MPILKLPNAGDTYTGTVTGCREDAGNFGPQVRFDFGADTLYLPKDSADRQLGRIPLTYAECVGLPLTFSRDPNPKAGSKPYWGIKLAEAGSKSNAPSGKRLTAAQAASAPPHKGPLVPQPFDEPAGTEADPYADFPPEEEDRFEAFNRAIDGVAASHKAPSAPPSPDPRSGKAGALEEAYLALYSRVAERLVSVGRALEFPVDGTGIQAATATVWISLKDRGLAP